MLTFKGLNKKLAALEVELVRFPNRDMCFRSLRAGVDDSVTVLVSLQSQTEAQWMERAAKAAEKLHGNIQSEPVNVDERPANADWVKPNCSIPITMIKSVWTIVFENTKHTPPSPTVWVCRDKAACRDGLAQLQAMPHINVIQWGLSHVHSVGE